MPARLRVLASTMGLLPILGACIAALLLLGPVGEALSCRGASGSSTDWFVALKAAASEYGVPGTSYAYLDRCVRAAQLSRSGPLRHLRFLFWATRMHR